MAFVGTNTVESAEELKQFLEDIKQEQNYYFLRSPHEVSGIKSELQEKLQLELQEKINSVTEGQVFNSQWELRWKRKDSKYELLLLSKDKIDLCHKFKEIEIDWQTEYRKARLYEANEIQDKQIRSKETRFPKGFIHNFAPQKTHRDKPQIGQRYFLNSQTATVHFIALTVQDKSS